MILHGQAWKKLYIAGAVLLAGGLLLPFCIGLFRAQAKLSTYFFPVFTGIYIRCIYILVVYKVVAALTVQLIVVVYQLIKQRLIVRCYKAGLYAALNTRIMLQRVSIVCFHRAYCGVAGQVTLQVI